jgi:hypothetical protein
LIQKAGENAQQLQANNMVVNLGIDEKRAREIYQEMNLQLRNQKISTHCFINIHFENLIQVKR